MTPCALETDLPRAFQRLQDHARGQHGTRRTHYPGGHCQERILDPTPTLYTQEAQAFARRWELVGEMEAAERRSTSVETRFRQLAALMASRELFGTEPAREAATESVRERWARLRQALNA
jgi:hypothetical protein